MTTENANQQNQAADQQDEAQKAAAQQAAQEKQGGQENVNLNIEAPADEVESTGDARQDIAYGWLKQAGVKRDSPAIKHAMDSGDFSLLESVLKEKGSKGFEPYVQLLKDARQDAETKAAEAKAATGKAVLAVFETQAAWDEARAWVGQTADKAEQEVLSGMLNGGNPTAAKLAARLIQQAFSASKAKSPPSSDSAVRRDAARQQPGPAGGAISPAEYQRELGKLVATHGDRGAFQTKEYQELRARRQLWRG